MCLNVLLWPVLEGTDSNVSLVVSVEHGFVVITPAQAHRHMLPPFQLFSLTKMVSTFQGPEKVGHGGCCGGRGGGG